jgi:hypothetical protein
VRGQAHTGLVRCADAFVILSKLGQGSEQLQRLDRWLKAKELTLNETKTRTVNFREETFHFLGFALSWRQGRSERNYPHVEPSAKNQQHLRDTLREELSHLTLWRGVQPTMERVNRILRGWAGYYHYRNSSRVFGKANYWVSTRAKRWLWRKQACAHALWADYPDDKLYNFYGLWPLPVAAGWTQPRTKA